MVQTCAMPSAPIHSLLGNVFSLVAPVRALQKLTTTPTSTRQSPWAQPEKSTIFEPQSVRQRQLFAAIDAVSEKDRAWFEANPDRTLRFRWATHDELEASREFGNSMLIPPGWAFAVMVLSLGGVRFRALVEIPLDTQPASTSGNAERSRGPPICSRQRSCAPCAVCRRRAGILATGLGPPLPLTLTWPLKRL